MKRQHDKVGCDVTVCMKFGGQFSYERDDGEKGLEEDDSFLMFFLFDLTT